MLGQDQKDKPFITKTSTSSGEILAILEFNIIGFGEMGTMVIGGAYGNAVFGMGVVQSYFHL